MQTNKISGENTIDVANGVFPQLGLIPLDMHPSSPNQRVEAAAVMVGAYGLIQPTLAPFSAAVKRSIELLNQQLTQGHMVQEVFTDSHAPIWLRAMVSLRLYLLRINASQDPKVAQVRAACSADLETLGGLVEQWFELHYAALSLGLVTSGPLAGTVLLPCARKTGVGKAEGAGLLAGEGGDPGNMVRDVWLQLVTPGATVRRTGPKFWNLDKSRQDTAAGPLTKLVLAEGGFGENLRRGTLPKLCAEFQITRIPGVGHMASFPNGLPNGKDAATTLWVDYASGRFSFKQDDPAPFADGPGAERTTLAAV